jgi:hypothetical protein
MTMSESWSWILSRMAREFLYEKLTWPKLERYWSKGALRERDSINLNWLSHLFIILPDSKTHYKVSSKKDGEFGSWNWKPGHSNIL